MSKGNRRSKELICFLYIRQPSEFKLDKRSNIPGAGNFGKIKIRMVLPILFRDSVSFRIINLSCLDRNKLWAMSFSYKYEVTKSTRLKRE